MTMCAVFLDNPSLCISIVLILATVFYLWPRGAKPVFFDWKPPTEISSEWKGRILENPSVHAHTQDLSLIPESHTKDEASAGYITNYDPATGYWLGTVRAATKADVEVAVEKAAAAQVSWAQTTFAQRRTVLQSLLSWILRDSENLARLCSRDSGKTLLDAAFGEILTTAEKLTWVISNGELVLKPEYRSTNMLLLHKSACVRYDPLGVVAASVSWNYPLHNMLSPIISSIFTGNAIIVKPSEYVAFTSHHITRAVRQCIEACGHNADIVQVLEACEGPTAAHLTSHPLVRHMTFIGGETVGRKIASEMGARGAPITLELGGKDPAVLLESTDLEFFIHTFMRGCFQSSNQNCIGIERFIVASSIYEKFVNMIVPRMKCLQSGSTLSTSSTEKKRIDMGAMISDKDFVRLEMLIQDAVKMGAELMIGGSRVKNEEFPRGHYFQPTLITNVTPDMAISQTELFAPILIVMKFHTLQEAISLANSTRYGLGSSVFGKNRRDCEYVAERLQCGSISINDFGVSYLAQSLPFGGAKASGFGRFGGKEGLISLCNPKTVIRDRWHGVVQTPIPPKLRYPFHETSSNNIVNSGYSYQAWLFVRGLINLFYGDTWSIRIRAIKDLI